MSNEIAPDDSLYVCCACGKTSTTAYGFDAVGNSTATPGWDESCMLNARLFPKSKLVFGPSHRVVSVTP